MNEGYVFANYFEVFRAFAFKAKEPVVHPVLRRFEPDAVENAESQEPISFTDHLPSGSAYTSNVAA